MADPNPKHRRLLMVVWIALLVWSAGLALWWHAQNERLGSLEAGAPGAAQAATATPAAAGQPAATSTPAAGESAWWMADNPGPPSLAVDTLALARRFDSQSALATIDTLAAPPFDGRRAGTAGGQAAAALVADAFADYGLEPAGDLQPDGSRSYFQRFPLDFFVAFSAPPVLELFAPDGQALGPFEFRSDFSSYVRGYAGSGDAQGPVVWANYCRHEDFDAVDVRGAVALCRQGGPEEPTRNAIEHGAAGLLLAADPSLPIDRIGRYNTALVPAPLPAFLVERAVVDALLTGSGYTFEDLTIQFAGLPLSTTARLSVALEEEPEAAGSNVLAILPGSDPAAADEIVIVGAHFDHVGKDPGGEVCTRPAVDAEPECRSVEAAVYWGANDNASGTASLLELARQWHAVGFRPRRSVLFAGWDAEEQGLWGSSHFVLSPTVPLENAVAMLNLDMVGAGVDELSVDGPGALANRLISLAPTFGITTTLGDMGRSDHVSFRQAGVDAAMTIWFGADAEQDPKLAHYHRPLDVPAVIEADKLQAVGELAGAALASLASTDPELAELFDRRAQAVAADDREAFLAASSAGQRAADLAWWQTTRAQPPDALTTELVEALAAGDVATATVRHTVTLAGEQAQRIEETVRLARQSDGWRVDGPALLTSTDDGLTLRYPTSLADDAAQILAAAVRQRAAIAGSLGAPRPPAAVLMLHPSHDALRAAAGLTIPDSVNAWAAGNTAHLVATADLTRTAALTDALTLLTLAQSGVNEADAPWLWRGLPGYLSAAGRQEALALQHLPSLRQLLGAGEPADYGAAGFPSLLSPEGDTPFWNAAAWAMTGYLLEEHGAAAAADLADALARNNDVDQAFQRALGQSAADFDAAWQASWRQRMEEAQAQIDALLERRQAAVLAGDRAAFLATSDAGNPAALADDAAWFDRSRNAGVPSSAFALSGQLAGLTSQGALADVAAAWQLGDGDPQVVRQAVRLPLRDGELVFGGPVGQTAQSGLVTLSYPPARSALAEALAPTLDDAYRIMASRLAVEPAPLPIVLHDSDAAFRLAAGLDLPAGATAAAVPDGSLHVLLKPQQGSAAVNELRNGLLDALVDHLLGQVGVSATADNRWLRVGLGRVALQWVDPKVGWQQAGRLSDKVPLALQQGRLWSLEQLPDPATLSDVDASLAHAESWDAVTFLIQQVREEGLQRLVRQMADGSTVDAAMQTALDSSLAEFQGAWQETAGVLHVPADWQSTAEAFDVQQALATASRLAGEEFAGRETGTEGGQRAAEAIADAFADLGLQPVGDGGFLQAFPISVTVPAGPPTLTFRSGDETLELAYRQDFLEWTGGHALGGQASGPVVWVRDAAYSGMLLDGKIVLRDPSGPLEEEAAAAARAGAGALILVTEPGPNDMAARSPIDASQVVTPTLPVLELTKDAFERLLTLSGHSLMELNTAPAAMPLKVDAEVVVPLSESEARHGANVLALLPGSDPSLADQVVIVGAHFDGPGIDGGGAAYPGANDNASGVATLLEIARSWNEAGVQPRRPVLFAAWDGDELGQLGSTAYLARPAAPLTATLGVLNLDNVGAGGGFFLTYQGDRSREAITNQALLTAATALDARADYAQIADPGDHTTFQLAGLPATLVTWAGANDDANTRRDTPDKLDRVKLGRTGQVVSLALRWLADH